MFIIQIPAVFFILAPKNWTWKQDWNSAWYLNGDAIWIWATKMYGIQMFQAFKCSEFKSPLYLVSGNDNFKLKADVITWQTAWYLKAYLTHEVGHLALATNTGIWSLTIWIMETFKIRTFWWSDFIVMFFKGSGFSYSPNKVVSTILY